MVWSDELIFKRLDRTVFGFGMGWIDEDDCGFIGFRPYGSSHVLHPSRFQRVLRLVKEKGAHLNLAGNIGDNAFLELFRRQIDDVT